MNKGSDFLLLLYAFQCRFFIDYWLFNTYARTGSILCSRPHIRSTVHRNISHYILRPTVLNEDKISKCALPDKNRANHLIPLRVVIGRRLNHLHLRARMRCQHFWQSVGGCRFLHEPATSRSPGSVSGKSQVILSPGATSNASSCPGGRTLDGSGVETCFLAAVGHGNGGI